MMKPFRNAVKDINNYMVTIPQVPYKAKAVVTEEVIGQTRYDLQTNQSVQNRVYAFPDHTIGAVWTRGIADPGFADRGSGYNYYDGSSWAPAPSARIETTKAGWPSYQPYGPNGEIVVTHHNTAGLIVCKRDAKGRVSFHRLLRGAAAAGDQGHRQRARRVSRSSDDEGREPMATRALRFVPRGAGGHLGSFARRVWRRLGLDHPGGSRQRRARAGLPD